MKMAEIKRILKIKENNRDFSNRQKIINCSKDTVKAILSLAGSLSITYDKIKDVNEKEVLIFSIQIKIHIKTSLNRMLNIASKSFYKFLEMVPNYCFSVSAWSFCHQMARYAVVTKTSDKFIDYLKEYCKKYPDEESLLDKAHSLIIYNIDGGFDIEELKPKCKNK